MADDAAWSNETQRMLRLKYGPLIIIRIRSGATTRDAIRRSFQDPEQGAALYVLDALVSTGTLETTGETYKIRPRLVRCDDGEGRMVGGSGRRGGRGRE